MSSKEELRNFIDGLTPAELKTILHRLPKINAALAAEGLPQITAAEEKQE